MALEIEVEAIGIEHQAGAKLTIGTPFGQEVDLAIDGIVTEIEIEIEIMIGIRVVVMMILEIEIMIVVEGILLQGQILATLSSVRLLPQLVL